MTEESAPTRRRRAPSRARGAASPPVETVEAAIAEPIEAVISEPVEAGITELVEAAVTEPVEGGITELVEAAVTEPVEAGMIELVEATVTEPVEAGITELVEAAVTEPVEAGITELVEAAVTEPVEAGIAELVEAAVTEPVEAGIAELVEAAVTEPVEARITERVEAVITEAVQPIAAVPAARFGSFDAPPVVNRTTDASAAAVIAVPEAPQAGTAAIDIGPPVVIDVPPAEIADVEVEAPESIVLALPTADDVEAEAAPAALRSRRGRGRGRRTAEIPAIAEGAASVGELPPDLVETDSSSEVPASVVQPVAADQPPVGVSEDWSSVQADRVGPDSASLLLTAPLAAGIADDVAAADGNGVGGPRAPSLTFPPRGGGDQSYAPTDVVTESAAVAEPVVMAESPVMVDSGVVVESAVGAEPAGVAESDGAAASDIGAAVNVVAVSDIAAAGDVAAAGEVVVEADAAADADGSEVVVEVDAELAPAAGRSRRARNRTPAQPISVNVSVPKGLGRRVNTRLIEQVVREALRREAWERPSSLDVHLIEDDEMQEVNVTRRGVDEATDVLSFPMLDLRPGQGLTQDFFVLPPDQPVHIGDVLISFARVESQAEEGGHSRDRELAFLTVHGVLHLLGYDHETDDERRQMRRREEEVLVELGLRRNGS